MNHLLYLLFIPLGRFLININHWYFLNRVIKKHILWLKGLPDKASDLEKQQSKESAEWIESNTAEITRVYELTGRGKPLHSFMDAAGYGFVKQQQLNLLENLLFQNTELLQQARSRLLFAKGYFLTNAKQSLNPLFWLEVLFFLPKAIFSASGIESSSKVMDIGLKIAQIIYWLLIIYAFIFKPELFNFIFDHKIA
jgi:hypothetical protein